MAEYRDFSRYSISYTSKGTHKVFVQTSPGAAQDTVQLTRPGMALCSAEKSRSTTGAAEAPIVYIRPGAARTPTKTRPGAAQASVV